MESGECRGLERVEEWRTEESGGVERVEDLRVGSEGVESRGVE